jgi:inosine-uridine nucleoside N-ribohydrolase
MGLVCKHIFGDLDAADIVFTCGADILNVGLNVMHQVVLTGNSNALVSLLLRMSSASGCS